MNEQRDEQYYRRQEVVVERISVLILDETDRRIRLWVRGFLRTVKEVGLEATLEHIKKNIKSEDELLAFFGGEI
jgi:hypothetical protein